MINANKLENNVFKKKKTTRERASVSLGSLSASVQKRTITHSTRPVMKSHTFNGWLLHLEPSLDICMSNDYF